MDPYYEQRLREEVLYLHSLWRQGPPRPPNYNPNSDTSRHLRLSNAKKFKKHKKKKPKLPPVSDLEWPCKEPSENPSLSSWPAPPPPPAPAITTAEEQARFAANQAQKSALKATREFLMQLDDDDEENEGASDENDFMDDDGYEEYMFFLNMFNEDVELRGYYEKNWKGGEYLCLVCGGIRNKVGKRFRNCVALVQHSTTIAKTKKRQAHRAFAQVICKVLGWDIDKLPASDVHVANSGEPKSNAEVGWEDLDVNNQISGQVNINNGEMEMKEVPSAGQEEELHNSGIPGTSGFVGDSVMLCKRNAEVGMESSNVLNQIPELESVNSDELVMKKVPNAAQKEALQNSCLPGTSSVAAGNAMLSEGNAEVVMEDLNVLNQISGSENVNNGKLVMKEVTSAGWEVDDANKCMENSGNRVPGMAEGNTESVVKSLCRNLTKTMQLENEMTNSHVENIVVNTVNNYNRNQN
ncbi:hypothetical protein NMG60_11036960 [Bertholletia excelsa]